MPVLFDLVALSDIVMLGLALYLSFGVVPVLAFVGLAMILTGVLRVPGICGAFTKLLAYIYAPIFLVPCKSWLR